MQSANNAPRSSLVFHNHRVRDRHIRGFGIGYLGVRLCFAVVRRMAAKHSSNDTAGGKRDGDGCALRRVGVILHCEAATSLLKPHAGRAERSEKVLNSIEKGVLHTRKEMPPPGKGKRNAFKHRRIIIYRAQAKLRKKIGARRTKTDDTPQKIWRETCRRK